MDPTTVLDTPTNEVLELQAGIAQYLTEIDLMREQMSRDQAEIDRSRDRTRSLLAEAKAALSPAGWKAA